MAAKSKRYNLAWRGPFTMSDYDRAIPVPYREFAQAYGLEEVQAVLRAMGGWIQTQGDELAKFQEEFARYVGTKYAFGLTNCTAALELCAELIGVREGDEVIVPGITFISTALGPMRAGAKAVFADIDPRRFTVTAASIARCITPRTKAVYVVHHFGQCADMDPILALARKNRIAVVEDCAHAPGATYKGRQAGSMGDYGCFSMHTVKNMTTLGEGGVITTNSKSAAQDIPAMRWVGIRLYDNPERYWKPFLYDIVGVRGRLPHNFCMGEAAAAVGRAQLRKLDDMNARRRELAARLSAGLNGIPGIQVPCVATECEHAWHLYTVLFDGNAFDATRDDLTDMLYYNYGIKQVPHYLPVYQFTLFREMGYPQRGLCPNAERVYSQLLNLPFHLMLTDEVIAYVTDSVREAVKRLTRGERARPHRNWRLAGRRARP